MKNDDPKQKKSLAPEDSNDSPAIYSLGHVDDQPTFSRRSFLEIAAMAAGTAALSSVSPKLSMAKNKQEQTDQAKAHKDAVTALAVNTDGKLLASGDKSGTINLWQLPEGTLLQSWPGHKSSVSSLNFPYKDDILWSLDEKGFLKRWKLPDGNEISDGKFSYRSQQECHVFTMPSNIDWFAIQAAEGGVEIRSKTTGDIIRSLKEIYIRVNALVASSDGSLLMAGGKDGKIVLWAGPLNSQGKTAPTTAASISSLTIAPNGKLALSTHSDGHMKIWSIPDLQVGITFTSTLGKPFSAAIRPQMDFFATGFEEPEILLCKLDDPAAIPLRLTGHAAAVRATVITPDGSHLITGSEDKTIKLWSLPEGNFLKNLINLKINYNNVEAISYEGKDIYGRSVTYTQPCGTPIPPGSVCVCNCVPGSLSIPKNHSQNYNSRGYCTCDLICTCNTVCTCQSVGSGYYVSYWYPN